MRPRVLAVDWSGDLKKARRKIWLAEAVGNQLVRLEDGRDREQLVAWLAREAQSTPDMIVGLDFAFSFPAWFVKAHGGSPTALWREAVQHGEDWLKQCEPPFWGKPGRKRPDGLDGFRLTDLAVPKTGSVAPKSPFQIGGAGAVGTGSVRGMVALHHLSQAGFSVWPFDEPRLPLLVEIYPRLLTGPVNKSSSASRRAYLDARYPALAANLRAKVESCEDAFDAAVSALTMSAHVDEMLMLSAAEDENGTLEGTIWWPPSADRAGEILTR